MNLESYFGSHRANEIEEILFSISYSTSSVATKDATLMESLETITEAIYGVKQLARLSDIWNVFKLVSPTYIANMDLAKKFCESRALQEKDVINLIIAIKLLFLSECDSNFCSIDKKYKIYLEYVSTHAFAPLKKREFENIYNSVNCYAIDENWLAKNSLIKPETISRISQIFNNELMASKAQQRKYISAFYKKTTMDEMMSKFPKSVFSGLNDHERQKKLKEVKIEALKAAGNPLNALCIVDAGKKTTEGIRTIPANDTMLECILIYNIFKNSVDLSLKSVTSCVVVGPSPFFIKQWALDDEVIGYPVTFIIENEDERDALNVHFQNRSYSGANKKEIEVRSFDEFADEVKDNKELKYRNILVIGSGISGNNRKRLRELCLKFSKYRQRLFYFGPDEDLVEFAGEIGSRDFAVKEACLIPHGLANVKTPKYKTFWICESNPKVMTKVIKLYRALKVNNKGDMQRISITDAKTTPIDKESLIATGNSLRKECERVERGEDSRPKRDPAKRVFFSPEIEVWYNVSSKHGKTRVEAYVRSSSDLEKATKRNRIDESRKHIGRIKEDEVLSWLKFTYPFSTASKKDDSKSDITIKIRDVIAKEYRDAYEKQSGDDFSSISFRTVWFIFPEIGEQLSPDEIQLLQNIAMGPLGELNIVDATADEFADALENYDELSQNKRALNLISILLDFAVRQGFCRLNVVDQAIREGTSSRKQFRIIRSNLAKKSLTKVEFLYLLSAIRRELDNNNWKYLGVLIRLCTGLQGNIVSALTWDDYEHVIDYDFYCFHI
ncbi:hypothetical protein, partial [Macellibacteroides fermentans]|uniref:hypothetical protein n=1 Tax=Macellibacteroides fermentans TaxID=879969 RepID=UPI00406C1EF2